MDEASETLMWNTPHKCEGCWSHRHLTRHNHHTSIHRKAIKIQISFQQATRSNQKPKCGWLFSPKQGEAILLFILLANSWADPLRFSTNTAEWKHPFGKCQSLWLTSCCNKHGKDSVSLADYSSYVLQKEYVRTEAGILSPCKQNQGKTSQAWSSLSIHASSTWGDWSGAGNSLPMEETAWSVSTN